MSARSRHVGNEAWRQAYLWSQFSFHHPRVLQFKHHVSARYGDRSFAARVRYAPAK